MVSHKEGRVLKNLYFRTVILEKTLESPLESPLETLESSLESQGDPTSPS